MIKRARERCDGGESRWRQREGWAVRVELVRGELDRGCVVGGGREKYEISEGVREGIRELLERDYFGLWDLTKGASDRRETAAMRERREWDEWRRVERERRGRGDGREGEEVEREGME
ncbi:hypothetical protein Tco_1045967 [Tanacetum coccineum]